MQRPNFGEQTPGQPGAGGPPAFLPPNAYYSPPQGQQPQQYAPNPFVVAAPNMTPTGHRMLPTILELVNSFKRRWVLCLLIGGIIGIVAALGIWMAMPSGKHQAEATIRLKANTEGGPKQDDNDFIRFVDSHVKDMSKKAFATEVATTPAVSKLTLVAGSDDPGATIKDMIKVKADTTEYVKITINGNDGNEIKTLLETFVTKYVENAKNSETRNRKELIADYQKSLEVLNKDIDERKKQLQEILKDAGVGNLDIVSLSLLDRELATAAATKTQQKQVVSDLEGKLEQLKSEINSTKLVPNKKDLEELLATSVTVATKQAAVIAATAALADANDRYNKGAPQILAKEQALAAAKAELEKAVRDVESTNRETLIAKAKEARQVDVVELERQISVANNQLKRTEENVKVLTEMRAKAKVAGQQMTMQGDDIDPLKVQRDEIRKKLFEQQDLERRKDTNSRIELVEGAQLWLDYNTKTKMVAAIIFGILGFTAVSLVIAYLEWRNRRVDGVDQVVQELKMRVIGTIPAFPSRAALKNGEASANQNWRFILNESVNSTRTMLLHTARTQQMQVILVTSAMQGEGKTSLSSQLATSMATAGLRTLILDCDLRNPSMQKLFDIPVAPGCAEILLQEIDISDTIATTSVPNLWIIPAGQCNHRVIAALAQGHPLEGLFNRLRGQFDIIIVDSCPILPVADTLLVAQHVDGVIFSILQDVSQLPKVQDASERLVQLNIPLVGAVVNGIKPDIQAYGYNYVKQLPA
jgi:polysaccharide biosynthesis transport protein